MVLKFVNSGQPSRTARFPAWLRVAAMIFSLTQLDLLRAQNDPHPHSDPVGAAMPSLAFQSVNDFQGQLGGVIGRRLKANLDQWLLPAPISNPGMIEMFRVRDRAPAPNLVPWAGEFVGKYLISAIQSLRLTGSEALTNRVRELVAELISTQADDGYLGPFPKATRLTGHWDLWGHYHCMQALLDWHEMTGDPAAWEACRKMADLMCRTFLDQPRRVFDAGSQEMNMAVIHGLGRLYRESGEPRYLRLMREIETDWERAGDYLRTGLAGVEFFQTPRPRWESLHDLQGLMELYRATGREEYRRAFEHHWRSIARWDVHNTGAFSSGEQATGNPYAPGAIETCCTVAWMALTLDELKLTGDPLAADELERSTFNAAAGAQHPSGRWWTYNTPMNGTREASAHSIVFQARAGTPELNCCSVNGPRTLGLLSKWALMRAPDGLVVNYYGPGTFQTRLADDTPVVLTAETDYPVEGHVALTVRPAAARKFTLKLRVPAWSRETRVRVNAESFPNPRPGHYLDLDRLWQPGDRVDLEFDFGLRAVPGDRECTGQASLYRGPLLLAYDQKWSGLDEGELPGLDLRRLSEARRMKHDPGSEGEVSAPWLRVELPTGGNSVLRLCDFASAGASGVRYRSWLPALHAPPPPPVTRFPADGATITAGRSWFKWTTHTNARLLDYRLVVAPTSDFESPVIEWSGLKENRALLDPTRKKSLEPDRWYYWKIVARNAEGETESVRPPARFKVDPRLEPTAEDLSDGTLARPDGTMIRARLRGGAEPEFGVLKRATGFASAPGPGGGDAGAVALNGRDGTLVYTLEEFPEEDYSMTVQVRVRRWPEHRLGQIFSGWTASMDDPLRVCVENGKLFARIEAQTFFSTEGAPMETNRWYRLAVIKRGGQLRLYLDGRGAGTASVPAFVRTAARDVALGGNPHFSGPEFLAADFSDFAFYNRALSEAELKAGK
jgi:uncharacterized protein